VAGVAKRKLQEPDVVNPILAKIQAISDEARRTLTDNEMARKEQLATLEKLIVENHAHLVTLGVGHPALEAVKSKAGEQPWGLHTKLTGAGGGGCAVTIIPDDFNEASLVALKGALADDGFKTYETTVGGSGFGLLLSRPAAATTVSTEGGSERSTLPAEARFRGATSSELAVWASTAGQWAYV